jgi:hypothetical protein
VWLTLKKLTGSIGYTVVVRGELFPVTCPS